MRLRLVALALALCSGCSKDLSLPDPSDKPRILDFTPRYAYAGDELTVWAENLDVVGNTLVFPGGARVQAVSDGLRDVVTDSLTPDGQPATAISFTVPQGLATRGRLVLVNTKGQSDPSGEWFYLPVPLLDQLDVVQ